MKTGYRMSRRTAGWLIAIFAALIVIHYAYGNTAQNLTRAVMGKPALKVALRGEVTAMKQNQMTVTIEDPHGDLTNLSRQIDLTPKTQYMSPGKPMVTGQEGSSYLKQGVRVTVSGQGTSQNGIEAQMVRINFPPISGTVSSIKKSMITVSVPGQPSAANIQLTSHTAFFVPQGVWNHLAQGAKVRVWVVPNQEPHSGLTAVTVMVTGS